MSDGIEVIGPIDGDFVKIVTPDTLEFVADLHRRFNPEREALLRARAIRQERLDQGEIPDFLPETQNVRDGDWKVAPVPADLRDRRVEITGPVERKMMINALNSGAKVFMADFEDSNSPTWENNIHGHLNLIEAMAGTIEFTSQDGKHYELADETATLMVRPRGWHLSEKHLFVDGHPISASLFDFGIYLFHNGRRSLERGTGPYFYLPKLESHLEARLWNDVFVFSQQALGIPQGTIKATVLIETILAAFEMEEILYELRDHSAGLNAGRWDYIFSVIKKFRNRPDMVLPDRAQVSMNVPFMRAYTELLVSTCHKRGAFAIGGMAAFIPSRRDPEINDEALRKVREDKLRESAAGCDGTWVAHPDLVPSVLEVFDGVLGQEPNQLDVLRDDVAVTGPDLLNTAIEQGAITEAGLRTNISVAILYLESWLRGVGAAALFNLMEDAATAEISRSQVWQWIRHDALMADGRTVTRELVHELVIEEMGKIREAYGEDLFNRGRFDEARHLFETVALSDDFPEFLTLRAYELID
ncbi:MAG: malate synthase A [Acidimicrobiia bacterium]